MKRISTLFLLLILVFSLSSARTHKFYVAIFQMDYVAKNKQIQITSRVFIDDIEKAFEKKYNKKFYIGTSRESKETPRYLKEYFKEHLKIKVNNSSKTIKYLGKDVEDDVLVCYYIIPVKEKIETISITNTTLFDAFAEQHNMIHTHINNIKKSLLLTIEKPEALVEY